MRQTKMSNFDIDQKWYVVDATDLILGRMSSQVAMILMGKNKPQYSPQIDIGDNVIITNASKIKLTGNKLNKKIYYNHSEYPGGMRMRTAKTMVNEYPVEMITRSIKGMIPKNRLGRQMLKKLHVYAGPDHLQEAQTPEILELKY